MRTHAPKFIVLLLLLLAVTSCGEDPTATPARPEASPTGAEVAQVNPSATVAPTAAPTATTIPATPTPVPTNTPRPEPTATATPTPVVLLEPADFGDNRNPLTGELVDDPAVLQHRPIAVKISNSPAQYVRPQSGLSQADLVFEHPTEGPITRFTALLYSQTPPKVGPIRSGRLIDVELPAMYDAAFAYSGSSIGVAQKLFASDFRSRILRSDVPGYYRTGEDKPYEHTLYGEPELWWEVLDERELNTPPQFGTQMAFTSDTPAGGEPAGEVTINYQDWTIVNWRYDEASGRYWRWADGEAHTDANTGDQLNAANVVVIFALHQLDRTICEYQTDAGCQAFSTEIQIWGQGRALIFRDGQQFTATWHRENRHDMFTFTDADGNPVPLQIGNTWFQVVALHYVDPVSVSP